VGSHRRCFDEALWFSNRSIPGPGLGGHCIPVDPFYPLLEGEGVGLPNSLYIELAGEINVSMAVPRCERDISTALNRESKPLKGSRVLILGVSYKKDVDDLRESPALTIIELLKQQGAIVSYKRPVFPIAAQRTSLRLADGTRFR